MAQNPTPSYLDPNQITKRAFNEADDTHRVSESNLGQAYDSSNLAIRVRPVTGVLVTEAFNEIDLTYVVAGFGTGEIQTATYKNAGTVVAVLTLTYDSSNRLSTVVKT